MAIQTMVETFHYPMEKDELMIRLFIDLSLAFDTSHNVLLRKLNYYGIYGNSLSCLHNYLTTQSQYVTYNNCNSDMGDITIGVPQV